MNRKLSLSLLLLPAMLLPAGNLLAQDAEQTLKALEARIAEQQDQLKLLTREVARLSDGIEALQKSKAPAAAATPVASAIPVATAVNPPKAERVEPAVEIPVATAVAAVAVVAAEEPAANFSTHVVAKGETLTGISRLYKVDVQTLQTFNAITDGRHLQIGQTLKIPTTPPAPAQ